MTAASKSPIVSLPARCRRADFVAGLTRRLPARRWQCSYWLARLLQLPRRPFIGRFRGGLIEVHRDEVASAGAYFCGFYEREVTSWVLAELAVSEPNVVFDVGANFGYYPLLIGLATGGRTRVVAFEPDPMNRAWLERNLALNPRVQCEVVAAAVAAESDRTVTFEVSSPGRSLWSRVSDTDSPVIVPTISIDDWCDGHGIVSVPLTLIDVEGFEGEVLAGMHRGFLAGRYRKVMVEVHASMLPTEEPQRMFRAPLEAGYQLLRFNSYRPPDCDKRRDYYDTRFRPSWLVPPMWSQALTEWEHFLLIAPEQPS